MLIKEVLSKSVEFLRNKTPDTPRLDAELLISWALGLSRVDLYMKYDCPLKDEEVSRCREVIARRGKGEPVAYIKGERDFYGRTFKVNSSVLIPRPESEGIIEQALAWIKSETVEKPQILDLGTGSGILGITLATEIPQAQVTMVDISNEALKVARENATNLGVKDRCEILNGDAAKIILNNKFDLVVANPPYIKNGDPLVAKAVFTYEPHQALYSGPTGLEFIESWLNHLIKGLAGNSLVLFEIGADQGQAAKDIFTSLQVFATVEVLKDLSGYDRIIRAVKNG